jgi:hypothetical protein
VKEESMPSLDLMVKAPVNLETHAIGQEKTMMKRESF